MIRDVNACVLRSRCANIFSFSVPAVGQLLEYLSKVAWATTLHHATRGCADPVPLQLGVCQPRQLILRQGGVVFGAFAVRGLRGQSHVLQLGLRPQTQFVAQPACAADKFAALRETMHDKRTAR